jgi:hypothetical protein
VTNQIAININSFLLCKARGRHKKVLDTCLENLHPPNEPHSLTFENHDRLLRTSQPHKKPQGLCTISFFPHKISPKSVGECDVSTLMCRQRASMTQLQAVMTSQKNQISIYDVIIVTSTFLYVLKNNHELTVGPSQPHLSECSEFFLWPPLVQSRLFVLSIPHIESIILLCFKPIGGFTAWVIVVALLGQVFKGSQATKLQTWDWDVQTVEAQEDMWHTTHQHILP